jgi:hypothetical protein
MGKRQVVLEVAVVPAMQLDVPATAPIEELAPADPGELGGPTARAQSPLDEPGQGPELNRRLVKAPPALL